MQMTQCLHRAVRLRPGALATDHAGRTRTVAESADRIARLAGALRSLGVTDDDRVGILGLNSDRFHEALLAVPWAGALVNPINTRWAIPEMVYALDESGVEVLLVDDAFISVVPDLRAQLPLLREVIYLGDEPAPGGVWHYESLIETGSACEDRKRGGDDLYGLFYTGGTTGRPKAVMLSHANMLTSALGALATDRFMTPEGACLHVAPMFHLAAIGMWTLGNLVGTTHVTLPAFAPDAVVDAVRTKAVTDALFVPTMVQMLVDSAPDPAAMDTVKTVVYGASPMPERLLDRAMRLFRSADFVQGYGMTELAPFATILFHRDHLDPSRRTSNGKSLLHTEVRIADADDRDVPAGCVGEVLVRGPNVMSGYYRQPDATAAALRGGWMHTGDAGYLDDDGYLHVVDRIKDMIISGGENVYSAEVENALCSHPAVASCAVVGVPDERWGECVHAVVVLRPGETASETELREHCRAFIAGYKVPQAVSFVTSLPLSGVGKVLKRELVQMIQTGRADSHDNEVTTVSGDH